jgi:multidrug efflux pump subunit AcrA (membrane-fusion protein)
MVRSAGLIGSIALIGALSACVEDTGGGTVATVSPEAQACLRAVTNETNNPNVVLLSSDFSQAGTEVIVGVGPQRARWQCIAYRDGSTSRPMSLTDEGFM